MTDTINRGLARELEAALDEVARLEKEQAQKVELIEMLKECLDPVGRLARLVCGCDHDGPCKECATLAKPEALLERVS